MKNSYFPYEFRENQKEAIDFIADSIEKNVCIDAPTGFGKTPVILSALLDKAKNNGLKIIWAVKTGNETDRPIEELKRINNNLKSRIFGLSYRGKKDMCLLLKDLKLEKANSDEVTYICKKRKKNCKYYSNFFNLNSKDFDKLLKGPILYSDLLSFAEDKRVCAYELQRFLLPQATVVGLNYNYILSDAISWAIKKEIPFSECFLVVDEAHNLQSIAANLNSDKITLGSVHFALLEIEKFEDEEVKEILLKMRKEMLSLRDNIKDEAEFNAKEFLRKVFGSTSKIIEILSAMKKYGSEVRKERLKQGKIPRSSLYHLANFWHYAIENFGRDGIAFLATRKGDNLTIETWDMRAEEILKDKWKDYASCVFCSGTLNPIDAFAETVGLKDYTGRHFPFQFSRDRVISLITSGLTTKGEKLSKEMIEKYLETIDDYIRNVNANIAVFSASYRIQTDLMRNGLEEIIRKNGREFFLEREGMHGRDARRILDGFKACAYSERKGVLCATMFGRFAEGADFPGEELVGIFLVGIPFDKLSVRTKLYLDYYKKLYGKTKGVYYGYIIPALKRASQALGRALRSKEDRAIFVCGDERYAEKRFFRLLPSFVKDGSRVVHYKEISRYLLGL